MSAGSRLWLNFQVLRGGWILCQADTCSLCCLIRTQNFKGSPVQPFGHVLGISPEAGKGMLLSCCAPGHFTSFSCPTVAGEHAVKRNSQELAMGPELLRRSFAHRSVCLRNLAHSLSDTLPYRLRSSRTGLLGCMVPLPLGFPHTTEVPALHLTPRQCSALPDTGSTSSSMLDNHATLAAFCAPRESGGKPRVFHAEVKLHKVTGQPHRRARTRLCLPRTLCFPALGGGCRDGDGAELRSCRNCSSRLGLPTAHPCRQPASSSRIFITITQKDQKQT